MRAKTMGRVAVALLLAMSASSAQATFHLIKVVEVFPGTPAAPAAQYVVIQMYAAGQEFVGTHAITVFDGSGTLRRSARGAHFTRAVSAPREDRGRVASALFVA